MKKRNTRSTEDSWYSFAKKETHQILLLHSIEKNRTSKILRYQEHVESFYFDTVIKRPASVKELTQILKSWNSEEISNKETKQSQ